MLMLLGFLILMTCLVIGVRRGGIGLATVSGIGLVFFIFVMGLKPGKPPVDVMLTIMAVVTCSAFLQASKGLDVMLKYAEKFLRSNPKYITILAPLTTWFLAVLCGTGHVVYAMFPIIYDIAIKQNIRPERPMSVSSIASQMGVCASPASVAVVSVVAILGATEHPFGVMQILSISIPATFVGVVVAGLWSINRGKDLDNDLEFQAKIADPEQKEFIYGGLQEQSLLNIKLPKSAYQAALIFLLGIGIIALFGSFPQLLPKFPDAKGVLKPFSMTPTIQLMMLSIAAIIMMLCNVKTAEVASGSVFKSGMTAIVSVYGVAWMADTYFGAYLPVMRETLSNVVLAYPWMYAIVLFLVSKLINSQAAAVTVIVPMALSVGVDPLVIVGFMPAAYGYFVLPTYPSDLACIGFDRSGTTNIGKFIINHSFLIPGFIGVGSACLAGYILVHLVY
ncbi:MAG TPA: anaerobic C4-dicarboxylate transporter [Candidatus Avacidaminococcus intestinavium]|uniref:Anaerobic C4-dicarboxylate transporter n=1 Tax=Candidatus Avacidaminococcus intestinavium TaxID=2840684 RepID=A0A9D1SLF4_9FIRM|nr:anaerobic C4-dicarboxylate transporter [Candidatus Avacidaminococcus intestinavium]